MDNPIKHEADPPAKADARAKADDPLAAAINNLSHQLRLQHQARRPTEAEFQAKLAFKVRHAKALLQLGDHPPAGLTPYQAATAQRGGCLARLAQLVRRARILKGP